jgi:hypothetical protein
MSMISFDNLEPGMVLAADVKDRSGRVLLAAGNSLTEKTLRVFKMWGVTEADVQGVAQEEIIAKKSASLNPELVQAAEQNVNTLFTHCDKEQPLIKELYRLTTLRAARKLEDAHGNNA